jgi:hypothetical protein
MIWFSRCRVQSDDSGGGHQARSAFGTDDGEAQSAFRAAQAKYAALAGYQILIRKKDQGGRGVFYAA